jgi:hypothetical protein
MAKIEKLSKLRADRAFSKADDAALRDSILAIAKKIDELVDTVNQLAESIDTIQEHGNNRGYLK